MSILIFLIVLYILLGLSMMKLFEKAGIPGWKALVPGVAAVEWAKMIGRKPQYAFWLLFPVVNFFIYAGMVIDMARSFGRHGFWTSVLAVIFAPIPFFMIGRDENAKYLGPVLEKEREYFRLLHEMTERKDVAGLKKLEQQYPEFKKGQAREWTEAIVFAVFAAAFIRMFLIEAYVIPSSSMEGSLKVGDYLFVSKAHYGIRTPMTVFQVPLLHNRLPFNLGESYTKNPSLPYYRLPKLTEVKRFDPVVFNWPVGDSVLLAPDRSYDIGQWNRIPQLKMAYGNLPLVTRPMDKKDHYVKRCVGLPGDSLQIKDRQLYVNGQVAANPTHMQFGYSITPPAGSSFNMKRLDEFGVNLTDVIQTRDRMGNVVETYFNLDAAQVEKIRALGMKVEPWVREADPGSLYPNDPNRFKDWTVDNFGPIWIPKAGATTPLNMDNICFYWRVIKVYEGNDLVVKDGKIFINGSEANSYTFKQDYYWMQGDNRHNSEDSRVWGYVPADHIVGKPLFIWFSTKNGVMSNGINWNRIFKSASAM